LSHLWEWNHNPDTSKFSVGSGLKLSTATVTFDIYAARNTLTRRIHGGQGTGTLELDFTNMADGDRAGLALLRDSSAWVGVKRDGSTYTVCFVNSITMNSDWTTQNTGVTPASVSITSKKVWLRITADIRPGGTKNAQFYWSTDGNSFTQIGGNFAMKTEWQFFMGYRYGIFNYGTKALGGSVVVNSFTSS
jgi:beta-xylosidase